MLLLGPSSSDTFKIKKGITRRDSEQDQWPPLSTGGYVTHINSTGIVTSSPTFTITPNACIGTGTTAPTATYTTANSITIR